jgi:Low molecular weight phosphotyrosine protein phosphatase
MPVAHYNVLFLSNRNTARSIFAEAVMNRIGGERFTGFSAGMRPAAELDPLVCDILRVAHYPTEGCTQSIGRTSPELLPRRSISSLPYVIPLQVSHYPTGRADPLPPIGIIPIQKS